MLHVDTLLTEIEDEMTDVTANPSLGLSQLHLGEAR
jgi:hypothetical protein